MTDTPPDLPDQTPFSRWLHAQAKGDQARLMPYAGIYNWGRHIQAVIGWDGRYNSELIAMELAQQGATAEDLAALVSAEAAWRVDTLIDSAEIAGVPLDVGTVEVIPDAVSKEIEASEAIVLCGYRNHRGEGCVSPAVAGAGRCGKHGGAITDPEVRRSFLLVAFAKVIDGSRVAVDALLDVAENGRSEMARVQAAKELLDRAGVSQDQQVTHIHTTDGDVSEDELLSALRSRLLETKNRLRLTAVEAATGVALELSHISTAMVPVPSQVHIPDSEIIDAEIIEDEVVEVE